MAERKARVAGKAKEAPLKHPCPNCGAESKVVLYAGYGRRGFFWVCDKNCGYTARTR